MCNTHTIYWSCHRKKKYVIKRSCRQLKRKIGCQGRTESESTGPIGEECCRCKGERFAIEKAEEMERRARRMEEKEKMKVGRKVESMGRIENEVEDEVMEECKEEREGEGEVGGFKGPWPLFD